MAGQGAVSVERDADGGGGEVWGLRCNSMFRDPAPKSESLPSDGLLGTSYTVPLGSVHLSLAAGHPAVLGLLLISAAGKDSCPVT